MINFKFKKLFILFFALLMLSIASFAAQHAKQATMLDYDTIYDGLEEADFDYIFGLDPYQSEEYKKYMYSPYPLFRSGVTIVFKSKVIPPGYYLLTPREKEGKTWVLFKDNGRVLYTIPVYHQENIDESFYKDKLPHQKLTWYQTTAKKSMEAVGKVFGKKNQRTPIPKAYIEFNDRGEYWDMILYYGLKKYYLLFKKG